jgi:hypothetical protein
MGCNMEYNQNTGIPERITMPFQYHHEPQTALPWVVTLDGYEITRFATEPEAATYCAARNAPQ